MAIDRRHLTAGIASKDPRVGRFRGSSKATVLGLPGGRQMKRGVRGRLAPSEFVVVLGGAVLVRRGGVSPPDQAPRGWAERAYHDLRDEGRMS